MVSILPKSVLNTLSGLGFGIGPSPPAVASPTPPPALYQHARSHFGYFSETPSHSSCFGDEQRLIFFENAGGSQVPVCVADAVREYMIGSYAQLGAGYPLSTRATNTVAEAHEMMKTFVNGHGVGEVAIGPSTSQLAMMVAECYSHVLQPDDEVIIHEAAHEANVGAWEKCAKKAGCVLKTWELDSVRMKQSPLDALGRLVTPKTRIVAVAHVSNLLGEITDVAAVVKLVKSVAPNARVVVDGVAYAPHRAIDVKAWGCDWYVWSVYKVFGPHMAVLFGTNEAFADLESVGPNHFWISGKDVPYKFELGGPSHEACAGLVATGKYFEALGGWEETSSEPKRDDAPLKNALTRESVEKFFARVTAMELPLQEKIVNYLSTKPKVTIIGPGPGEPARVATISFVHSSKKSSLLTKEIQDAGFAMRNGHMYSYRLATAIKDKLGHNDIGEGVVRLSLVHYNTPEEVDALCAALENLL